MIDVIVMFGPPGVGKGTQSKIIAANTGMYHFSTGEKLREEIKKRSNIGIEAQRYLKDRKFVPDSVVYKMVQDCFRNEGGLILDGFPRNVVQAEYLDGMLVTHRKDDLRVVNLYADENELVKRMKIRAEIEKREDDSNPEVIIAGLREYREKTKPVLDYFKLRDRRVYDVLSLGTTDQVSRNIFDALQLGN